MQIINDYSIKSFFETTFSAQSYKKSEENQTSTFDTVSISDTALQAYANSKAASITDENESGNNLSEQFKKQFNSYRGKGIFSEDDSVSKENSVDGAEKAQQTEEEKLARRYLSLKKKLRI